MIFLKHFKIEGLYFNFLMLNETKIQNCKLRQIYNLIFDFCYSVRKYNIVSCNMNL